MEITIDDVADFIIFNGESCMSHRKLQKMLYLAQGFYLSENKTSLYSEDLEAWKHGPVNPKIYQKYKHLGYHSIPKDGIVVSSNIPTNVKAFLMSLILFFGSVGQDELIEFSHMDSPWAGSYIEGANKSLSKDMLQSYFSGFSNFSDYVDTSKQKSEFSKLIASRCLYLKGLHTIGDEWISGKSKAPDRDICFASRMFLENFERALFAKESKPEIPRIILGPIPSGGVGLEIITTVKSVYLHIHNDKSVEIAFEIDGFFKEAEMTLEQFGDELGTYLEEIV